jgi:ubiquinone/menaquinone biosynthesis C-methylase UbiE
MNTDYVSDTAQVVELPEVGENERRVHACMADNMRLPFPSASFDCYISNMSMQIVPDYRKQLAECFRVLGSGSRACFTVWGRPEQTLNFVIAKKALCELNNTPYELNPNFKITNAFETEVKEEIVKAGFSKDIRSWY